MRSLFHKSLVFVIIAGFLNSCAGDRDRNYQYFPDMYRPVPYEPYGAYDIFANQQEAKLPVDGTIPRGWEPYDYPDSNEGYEMAKANLLSPIEITDFNISQGKELYEIYCSVCHGDKGDGMGILAQREKFLGIPAYIDREITPGSIYHVLMYGINAMGSHSGQVNEEERWQIAQYVMKLREESKK